MDVVIIVLFQDKSFSTELIRNSLYLNTARVMTAVGCLTALLAVFGFYSAQKVRLFYIVFKFSIEIGSLIQEPLTIIVISRIVF